MNINAGFMNNLRADQEGTPIDVYSDEMLRQYLETALWSSTDESTPEGGEPMDANYDIDDFAPEALEMAKRDVDSFREKAADLLAEWPDDEGQVGHDFWLTRNHHGAGFWDRYMTSAGDSAELQALGDKLTEVAQSFGETDPWISKEEDDVPEAGKVHFYASQANTTNFVAKTLPTHPTKSVLAKRKKIRAAYEQPTIKEQTPQRLVIQVSQEWRDELSGDDPVGDRDLYDVFDSIIGNSELDWIQPEEIGALTDAPIIGEVLRDDQGELVEAPMVWWYPNYQVQDPIQDLIDTGELVFEGAPENEEQPKGDGPADAMDAEGNVKGSRKVKAYDDNQIVKDHKDAGQTVYLFDSSYGPIAALLADYFGDPEEYSVEYFVVLDEDGGVREVVENESDKYNAITDEFAPHREKAKTQLIKDQQGSNAERLETREGSQDGMHQDVDASRKVKAAANVSPEVYKQAGVEVGELLPAHAWPGGYTLIYLTRSNDVLCSDCADKNDELDEEVIAVQTFDEGSSMECDGGCGKMIESSYGDPDVEGKFSPGNVPDAKSLENAPKAQVQEKVNNRKTKGTNTDIKFEDGLGASQKLKAGGVTDEEFVRFGLDDVEPGSRWMKCGSCGGPAKYDLSVEPEPDENDSTHMYFRQYCDKCDYSWKMGKRDKTMALEPDPERTDDEFDEDGYDEDGTDIDGFTREDNYFGTSSLEEAVEGDKCAGCGTGFSVGEQVYTHEYEGEGSPSVPGKYCGKSCMIEKVLDLQASQKVKAYEEGSSAAAAGDNTIWMRDEDSGQAYVAIYNDLWSINRDGQTVYIGNITGGDVDTAWYDGVSGNYLTEEDITPEMEAAIPDLVEGFFNDN